MKNICKKIANVLSYIYGTGIALSLLVAALSFIGYLVAFIIGGETATEICRVIYKEIYPHLFVFASVMVLLGVVKMYLNGEVAFALGKKKTDEQRNKEAQESLERNTNVLEGEEIIEEQEESDKKVEENVDKKGEE